MGTRKALENLERSMQESKVASDTTCMPGTLLYDWMALLLIKTVSRPILKIRKSEISLSKVTTIVTTYIELELEST